MLARGFFVELSNLNQTAYKAIKGNFGRKQADLISSVTRGLAPDLRDELLALADNMKATLPVLAYVARFPHNRQREGGDLRVLACQTSSPARQAGLGRRGCEDMCVTTRARADG